MHKQQGFSWRIFISLALAASFLMLLVSGIVLYLAPPGRIANWSDWMILGLSKSAWQHQHTIFGYAFALLSLFHLFAINWKAFLSYLKSKASGSLSHPVELLLTLLLTLLFGFGTHLRWQPFEAVVQLGETLSESWEPAAGAPPVPHAETMSIAELSRQPAVGRSVDELLKALEAAGIPGASPERTLGDLAQANAMTASALYDRIVGKSKQVRSEGFGRTTLAVIAEEAGISPQSLQLALSSRGIEAETGETMRAIAAKNGAEVQELRNVIEEIVR